MFCNTLTFGLVGCEDEGNLTLVCEASVPCTEVNTFFWFRSFCSVSCLILKG